ncbi:MAG: hypothetical protein AAGD01_12415 [Acidobacteriota bacterium]
MPQSTMQRRSLPWRAATALGGLPYALLTTLLLTVPFLACAPAQEPVVEEAAPEPVRVENAALGIAISELASQFDVADNGESIVLQRNEGEGTVTVTAQAPEIGGVNLIDLIAAAKEDFNSRPGGEYHGQVELGSQLGTAFSVRGSYTAEDGSSVEERHVYSVHPSGDKALVVRYAYPQGDLDDTRARTNELFEDVFSLIEALAPTPPVAAAEEATSESDSV